LEQRRGFRCGRNASDWVGSIDWLGLGWFNEDLAGFVGGGGFSATQTDKIWLKESGPKVNSGRVDRARWNSYFPLQICTTDRAFDTRR
jgi:hypothetical protein